jgi:hypothetical protein
MEQSPSWESNSHSASQEIPRLLWKPKVHYRVHRSRQLAPVMILMNPVHTLPNYFSKIHSNIILPPTLMHSEWSLPFRFPTIIFMHFSSHPSILHVHPFHLPWFDRPNNIWWSIHHILSNLPSITILSIFGRHYRSYTVDTTSVNKPRNRTAVISISAFIPDQ